MNAIGGIGFLIIFIALFISLIFSFAAVRRLRKSPHRSYDFEPQDLFSGTDITAIAAAASTPKWWREYRAKQGHMMLQEKHDWIMKNTQLWGRIIARVFIILLYTGLVLIMVASLLK